MEWTLKQLRERTMPQACIDGQWVHARPLNWKYRSLRKRLSEAWKVFTGKTESFTWPANQ